MERIFFKRTLILLAGVASLGLTQVAYCEATIDYYLQQAVANDQRIAQAQANVEAAYAGVEQSSASLRPQIGLESAYSHTQQIKPLDDYYTNTSVALRIDQKLWQRNDRTQTRLSNLAVGAAKIEVTLAVEQLLTELGLALFNVLEQRQAVEAFSAQQAALSYALESEQARFELGMSAAPRVTAARARANQVNARLIMARATGDSLRDELTRLVGTEVFLPDEITTPVFALPEGSLAAWQEQAKTHNSRLLLARNAIRQSDEGMTLAQRTNDPSLGLFGRWSYSTNPNGMDKDNQFHQIGVQLRIPLYTGGASAALSVQAEKNNLRALLERDYQQQTIASNLRVQWRRLETQLTVIEASALALVSTEQLLEINQLAYDNNTISQQALLDAQSDYYNAKRDLSSAQFDFYRWLIDFYALAGRLDQTRFQSLIGDWI